HRGAFRGGAGADLCAGVRMKAWHWVSEDKMTRYEPRVPVVVGETLRVEPPIALCERGFHASIKALDALPYAPGPICCRVELSGEIKTGDDKIVATERKVLWMCDATNVLHEMACISAETALLIANVDDHRCWEAIEAKRACLRGEIDDATLDAARDAARGAALDAAWGAAWAAVWGAAWAAVWATARAAARAAAGAAVWG